MYGLRLRRDDVVHTLYRIRGGGNGPVLLRIAWNGDEQCWMAGDGFFAHEGTGWRWCPEDFRQIRGIAWRVSGMGGADDDSRPISQSEALTILASHGVKPDSVDLGKYPSDHEQRRWQRLRQRLRRNAGL